MANEKRLIDVNDVYALFDENGTARLHVADIDLIPRVDAVEVVHGRWKLCDGCGHICSICGFWVALRSLNNYCPNCGANMRGSEE